MATGTQGQGNVRDQRSAQGGSESIYDQAGEAISNIAERASDLWDDAYEGGARAIGNVGGVTLGALVVAGAVGYGIAWLAHGQQWHQPSSTGSQPARSRQSGGNQQRRDHR